MSYLLFAWAPTGYELREQEGDLPQVGDVVELDGRRVSITKIGVSPLPGDNRPCAYSTGS
jgi:hypothetical protein